MIVYTLLSYIFQVIFLSDSIGLHRTVDHFAQGSIHVINAFRHFQVLRKFLLGHL